MGRRKERFMALDKAVKALLHGKVKAAGAEMADFAAETVDKGKLPPNTHGAPIRALELADTVVHGAAMAAGNVPVVSVVSDGLTGVYGFLKFAVGKGAEKVVGKGGTFTDLKNSGRKSMTAAGRGLGIGSTKHAPVLAPLLSPGMSAAAHAAATAQSYEALTRTGSAVNIRGQDEARKDPTKSA
jgi:hypothetical protein